MRSDVRNFCGGQFPARHRAWMASALLSVVLGPLALPPAIADGCFVFRWNKGIDINEPTQKAIIVYDAGREDLLLQVKFEGPLEEFGWLIPVPSLPTVEKGSMQPFYELSQLTQRHFGAAQRGYTAMAGGAGGPVEAVKVIDVKTVGAYEVAVLSAQDAGSLQRWLKAHDYSIPKGKTGIIREYIRKGWYFIAAKINLGEPVGVQRASDATPKSAGPAAQTRKAIQKQLSSGELHPLLISFDTPKCIYPLRISAMSGKPSEVSLYVLSAEPLLNEFIFSTDLDKLRQEQAEWEKGRPERVGDRDGYSHNLRIKDIYLELDEDWSRLDWKGEHGREWSFEDLEAIAREDELPASPSMLDAEFYTFSHDPLQCQRVTPDQILHCINDLRRLKARSWYLTKQVRTFQPHEMHDLEFQPAIPVLAAMLPEPEGGIAVWLLTGFEASGTSVLVAACRSTNSLQRIHASSALQMIKDSSLVEPLLTLLKDDKPRVRLNAVHAAIRNWDPRFTQALLALFRDPCAEIRQEAIIPLVQCEATNVVPACMALLRDPDPEVQSRALDVLWWLRQDTVPRADLLRVLGSERVDTVNRALAMLYHRWPPDWSVTSLYLATRFLAPSVTNDLSSAEAAPLMTNRLTMARLMGLKILRRNADAQAVALTLPLLRDTNSFVRDRALDLLRTVSGQNIPKNEPAKWEQWWAANKNLFAESEPGMGGAFVDIMRSLARDTYLTSLVSEPATYRQGENVKLMADVFNGGRRDRNLRLTVSIYAGEPRPLDAEPTGKPCAELIASVTAPAGKAQPITLEWKPGAFRADFYYLLGHLWEGDREIDSIESAFLVRNEKAMAKGPALNFRDNYLRLGKRPMFLFGTDDWSYTFSTRRETPLQWLRDMRARRDLGVQIYENLQFGIPAPANREELLRKVDGIVQLAQEYQQVYFAGLLVGANVAASDAELAQHTAWCRDFAQRYARAPGLIYYLNGDLRCELSAAVTPQLNQFLQQRYGSDERLRAAWGDKAPSQPLGSIPAEDFNDTGHAWEDTQVCDLNRFRAALIRRWSGALIRGIREYDAKHPTSSEFYQLPHQGVDIPAGIDGLDLCNFGYFDKPGADIARFPAICKYNDQRARGKSVGPGEYGVKTHPAWGDGQDYGYHVSRTPEQAASLFLAIAHYSLGLGASSIHNWCWKDSAHNVFPWGMVYPCDEVPKDIAYVHRNQSLLFRHFAPVYREPNTYVLTADNNRMGGGKWQVIEGILKSVDLALATHVDNLGTLNEDGLVIPPSAKAIFYALPFCPTDETFIKIRDWVRQGGVLYLSGDISYDEFHRRTRTQRLEELCGVRFLAGNYPNISVSATNSTDQPCIKVELAVSAAGMPAAARVLRRAGDGSPLLIENRLCKGTVMFSTDPIELHSVPARRESDLALYRGVLATAGIRPIDLQPDDPLVHAFRVPMQDGGQVYVLFNTDDSQPAKTVTLADCRPPITLSVASKRPGLVWFDGHGALRAVEAQGGCSLGDRTVLQDETGGMVLSLDQQDLRRSRVVLLLPLRPGSIRLSTDREWHRATVVTGDIHEGNWRSCETAPAGKTESGLVVNVSPDQVLSLLLVTESGGALKWCKAIERAMNDPASLP